MSTFVNSIYGLKIEHTTYSFLRFFVKSVDFRIHQNDSVIESMMDSDVGTFLKRFNEINTHWNEIYEGILNKNKKEFNMEARIAVLQTDFNQKKKMGGDPKNLLDELTSNIKAIKQEYQFSIKEKKLQVCKEKYEITLNFHNDTGGGIFVYNYDINLNKFIQDIFNFFQDHMNIPKITFGEYKLYENFIEEDKKGYIITRKDLTIDPIIIGDYRALGNLIKEWIDQDRLFINDRLEKIGIHFD